MTRMIPKVTEQGHGASGDTGTGGESRVPALTLVEQKKKEIEEAVIRLFREAQEQNPGASFHRLAVIVASQTGLSPEGTKGMLARHGIETTQKRKQA